MDRDFLVVAFNGGALVLGLILGITAYNHYRKINKKKGILWAIGCILTCLLFINGIIKIVDIMDEHRKEKAFELLEETYENRGVHEKESYENLELVVSPEKAKRYTDYNIYVANFNQQYTYKGKIKIMIKNKKEKVVLTHTTETVIIKPGEKKEVDSVTYKTWNPGYSWQWLGELKK
jgi:peptidyl-tRNA hydrolase